MPHDQSPATVIILCGVPAGTSATAFRTLAAEPRASGVPVTWVADRSDLVRLATEEADANWALSLDTTSAISRQELRQQLATVRQSAGSVDTVVIHGNATLPPRDILLDGGIRTAVVDRFDDVPRGNRRPAPEGWACRSVLWGLWEVQAASVPNQGIIERLLSWAAASHIQPGSLLVIHADAGTGCGVQETAKRLSGQLAWCTSVGRRCGVRMARAADLPALLGSGDHARSGSVLRAA
ncbi:MAG: hypothetical protein DWH79_01205 [Planctomycetota bacterium]|nr:MAG: hypothetical protein DWH79_01205 [Planctomycetota bacterium]